MQSLACILVCAAVWIGPLSAETVVPSRTIKSQTILVAADLNLAEQNFAGGFTNPAELVGLETRVVLYAGRPIRQGDVGAPALVTRNQIVRLVYEVGGLRIETEGRVLGRGAEGDRLRIMNLASRTTVTGTVVADGSIRVRQ